MTACSKELKGKLSSSEVLQSQKTTSFFSFFPSTFTKNPKCIFHTYLPHLRNLKTIKERRLFIQVVSLEALSSSLYKKKKETERIAHLLTYSLLCSMLVRKIEVGGGGDR